MLQLSITFSFADWLVMFHLHPFQESIFIFSLLNITNHLVGALMHLISIGHPLNYYSLFCCSKNVYILKVHRQVEYFKNCSVKQSFYHTHNLKRVLCRNFATGNKDPKIAVSQSAWGQKPVSSAGWLAWSEYPWSNSCLNSEWDLLGLKIQHNPQKHPHQKK
jgi:hypothetical protein